MSDKFCFNKLTPLPPTASKKLPLLSKFQQGGPPPGQGPGGKKAPIGTRVGGSVFAKAQKFGK